jgi:hypothetical protein
MNVWFVLESIFEHEREHKANQVHAHTRELPLGHF